MFIGEFNHSLDTKNRVSVPAKFRKELGKKAVITRGLDNSLLLYPMKAWQEIAHKLGKMPIGESSTRSFVRLMLSGASEVNLDSLGRILIPEYLKEYAFLKKNTVINGLFNRIEIWNDKSWSSYKKEAENNAKQAAEKLGELGIY
jgi:MraZ protein